MDDLKRAQSDGVVIGLRDVAGVADRLDVDELLLREPDTFNLLVLALLDLQNENETSDIMGWYQVTGIHGLPKRLWDGVSNANKDPNTPWEGEGYCAHGVITFPSWHRPYLSMMEQTIYAKMADKVKAFPASVQSKYQTALKKFRFPYWDYYRPRGRGARPSGIVRSSFDYDFSIPQIFTVEKIMVRRPKDDQLELSNNPFYRFNFPGDGGFDKNDWDLANADLRRQGRTFLESHTARYPNSRAPFSDNVTSLNQTLNQRREQSTRLIMNMINDPVYGDLATFASASQTPGPSGNLEAIHGNYHIFIGGPAGHMSSVPVAAFDPIFWLHHCQIDRWFAIWQAANPDAWFEDQDIAESDLLPFRVTRTGQSATFWNSNQSQQTDTFGYTYKDAKGSAQQAKDNFKRLYQWSVRTATRPYGQPPADMQPLPVNQAQVYQFTLAGDTINTMNAIVNDVPQAVLNAATATIAAVSHISAGDKPAGQTTEPSAPQETLTGTLAQATSNPVSFTNLDGANKVHLAPGNVDESKYSRDWYVDNIVERLALDGSFTIYYFLGDFDKQNTLGYLNAPTLAGVDHVFTASTRACDNCGNQAAQGHLVTGTNSITSILLDYIELGQLQDLSPQKVSPFLVKNLKWQVVTLDGHQVDTRTVPGFKVGVSCKLSPIPPTTGPILYEEHPEIIEEIIRNSS